MPTENGCSVREDTSPGSLHPRPESSGRPAESSTPRSARQRGQRPSPPVPTQHLLAAASDLLHRVVPVCGLVCMPCSSSCVFFLCSASSPPNPELVGHAAPCRSFDKCPPEPARPGRQGARRAWGSSSRPAFQGLITNGGTLAVRRE